jgi:RNA polymerase sigma factor (sigma-70 family)
MLAYTQLEPSIVEAARHGDNVAFQALYEAYHKRLVAFLIKRGLTVEQAEDAVQETMISVWQSFSKWPNRNLDGFRQFVFRVAFRKMLDAIRATKCRPVSSDYNQADECGGVPDAYTVELGELFSAGVARRPKQYTALNLRVQGYNYNEIAVLMRVTRAGAKSLLYNARNHLRAQWCSIQ